MLKEMEVKGFVYLHISECSNDNCLCKMGPDVELYDLNKEEFIEVSFNDLHKSSTFVNYFILQMFQDALNKFINSPSLHIAFAFYYYEVMKNIHAAYHELKIASKKRPTI